MSRLDRCIWLRHLDLLDLNWVESSQMRLALKRVLVVYLAGGLLTLVADTIAEYVYLEPGTTAHQFVFDIALDHLIPCLLLWPVMIILQAALFLGLVP